MKKAFKYITYVLFTFLPLVMTLLLTFNFLQDLQDKKYLGQNFDVEVCNKWLTYLTIIFPVIFIGIRNIYAENKINMIEDRTSTLLEMTKDNFYSLIKEICGDNKLPVEMKLPLRIYEPRYSDCMLTHIIKQFRCKYLKSSIEPVKFVAVSLDAKPVPCKPQYYVKKTKRMKEAVPQGIVGACYRENKFILDDNLIENATRYNLTNQQYNKVVDLNFAIAFPLANKYRITHIVTFDCRESFKIPDEVEDKVRILVIKYVEEVRKNFPQLFS